MNLVGENQFTTTGDEGYAVKYIFIAGGASRGMLQVRVDGELLYQKSPGRNPENPQPTPEEFERVTVEVLSRVDGTQSGQLPTIPDDIMAEFLALHEDMKGKLAELIVKGELTATGQFTEAYSGPSQREMSEEEKKLVELSA
uniref:Uncharacterized protein n=1 Tax=Octactis speculum TaxID=3111310 RepID=A0A7S2GQG3_9STRA|mmetsp:Transcript_53846/g.73552  ORF Transcript_53846/g.73552 Transcript_53846/m.73552 type:complete len:142 (+) Transcript_53846:113-538(+)